MKKIAWPSCCWYSNNLASEALPPCDYTSLVDRHGVSVCAASADVLKESCFTTLEITGFQTMERLVHFVCGFLPISAIAGYKIWTRSNVHQWRGWCAPNRMASSLNAAVCRSGTHAALKGQTIPMSDFRKWQHHTKGAVHLHHKCLPSLLHHF